jgi:hypothetical protein
MRMRKEFVVTFSSTDKKAIRDGILFQLTAVNPAYGAGPIRYMTTHLLERLGYLAPNAFGGRAISPEVSELFAAALEIFKKSEQIPRLFSANHSRLSHPEPTSV